jgi:putative tryptophan/tyrosine transport system substrate-binding protein
MRRREFLKLMGIAAGAVTFRAGAQEKHFRIGLISAVPPTPEMLRAFRDAMGERGYIEGQNVAFDVRWPKGTFSDDPDAVTHLVKGNFDVVVAWATPTVAAVRRQTSSIPIVMVSVGDPVGAGFVASLARPGGNITGVSNVTNDLSAKLVELFFEFVPAMKRVGVVSNSYNSNVAVQLRETEGALKKFSVQTKSSRLALPKNTIELLQPWSQNELTASYCSRILLWSNIARGSRTSRAPPGCQPPFSAARAYWPGGLFSYGGSIPNQHRFAAVYVDRILKGARPEELPVEQPTKFELVINLKAAKALDLSVPPTLLARADEVIE